MVMKMDMTRRETLIKGFKRKGHSSGDTGDKSHD
jgi:hypothetical protein